MRTEEVLIKHNLYQVFRAGNSINNINTAIAVVNNLKERIIKKRQVTNCTVLDVGHNIQEQLEYGSYDCYNYNARVFHNNDIHNNEIHDNEM